MSLSEVTSLRNAYSALELLRLLDVSAPCNAAAAIDALQARISSGDFAALFWGALLVTGCGLTPIPTLVDAIREAVRHVDASRIFIVSVAWLVVKELRLTDVESSLRALAGPFRLGDGYVSRREIQTPDIYSTATGFLADPGTPQERTRAAQLFGDQHGYWSIPPRFRNGNVVDLRTLYLGLWLDGRLPHGLVPILA
jgi:hypothetical protein